MTTDARGKTVPAATDHPARAAILNLSLSIRDAIPVTNATTRATALTTLAALSPTIVPSSSNPIFFEQADLPAAYRNIYTVDGSNFISLSGAFVWANSAALTAATTMVAGDKGYQVDTKADYVYSGTAWVANPAYCALRKSVDYTLTATAAAIPLDVEISDLAGMHDNVTNNTRITCTLAGLYEITAAGLNSNGTGSGTMSARLNGTTAIPGSQDGGPMDATAGRMMRIGFPVALVVGDYVEIMAFHSSAAGAIKGGILAASLVVTCKRIGPA